MAATLLLLSMISVTVVELGGAALRVLSGCQGDAVVFGMHLVTGGWTVVIVWLITGVFVGILLARQAGAAIMPAAELSLVAYLCATLWLLTGGQLALGYSLAEAQAAHVGGSRFYLVLCVVCGFAALIFFWRLVIRLGDHYLRGYQSQ